MTKTTIRYRPARRALSAGGITRRIAAVRDRDPKLATLRQIPIFSHLSRGELTQVAAHVDQVTTNRGGEELISEGTRNRTLVILLEGEADVSLRGTTLRRHGPGEILGLPSLLDGRVAGVTVTTASPIKALVASTLQFATLRQIGDLEMRFRSELSDRLRSDFLAVARPDEPAPAAEAVPAV